MWAALDWLFPPACAGCGTLGSRWCANCMADCARVPEERCALCNKSHKDGAADCGRATWLDAISAWGWHQDPLRKAIHQLKYKGNLAQGDALPVHLRELMLRDGIQVDLVVPVPLGKQRLRERGCNQADLLARPLAASMGLPYRPGSLARVRETASQVGMTLEARQKNVAGAFSARENRVSGQRVLLVDDVLTTGSKLDAAAQGLKEAGASFVAAVVVSRAV